MSESANKGEANYETDDAPASLPVLAIAATVAVVAIGALVVSLLLATVWQAAPAPQEPFRGPPAAADAKAPAFQANPSADLARRNRAKKQQLTSLGWVDREAGIVHIPIEQAMARLAKRGLPASTPNADQTGGDRE